MSVLWKADVYPNEEERRRQCATSLSVREVERIFNEDLTKKKAGFRFDAERLEDPTLAAAIAGVYPEARPIESLRTIYDA